MSNKPKRDNNRYTRARAMYTTANAVGLAIVGAAVAVFFTQQTLTSIIGVAVFASFMIFTVFVASLKLYQIEREQASEDGETQSQMLKDAVKEGIQEGLRDIIAETIRAELARSNLEDEPNNSQSSNDDADNDELQQKS
jgi:hypothetical protein